MGTLVIILLAAVAVYVVWKLLKDPDKNDDGKVDAQDVVLAAKEVAQEVKTEATEVVAKVQVQAAEAATQVVEKVKKARKPRAPKAGN